jgi:hypothetical protein
MGLPSTHAAGAKECRLGTNPQDQRADRFKKKVVRMARMLNED